MKLRMRKAKAARQVFLRKKKHHDDGDHDDDEDTDDEGIVPDRTVVSDESTQTTPSDESNNKDERWHRVQVKGEDDEDGRFLRSFSLDFPEEPFASVPETPVKKAHNKEPVWKKRLRHQGKSPGANERKPLRLNEDISLNRDGGEIVSKVDRGNTRRREDENQHDRKAHPTKLETKTVSFDKAGIEASRRTRKKHARRREQEKLLEAFEEESFDKLMRTESGYSDVFFNLFEEEDFSLATPTIYTDEATDESSAESSDYESGNRKSDEVEEDGHADEEEETSRHERRRSSRVTPISPRQDYDEDDDYDLLYTIDGCRSVAVFEELKMITELFIPDQRCICAKPEEETVRRGRSRRRKSRRSRSHS